MKLILYCRKSTESEDRQVLSIESQRSEIQKNLKSASDIQIIDVVEESRSAMTPGRPRFEEMMLRIERGEADGIAAWHPDRLSRNSIDAGRIIYALDRGVLKHLVFATWTFENSSQGKFMLQVMLGQSKYYSDNLSELVHRGNRTKLEKGWRPNRAPLGYRNNRLTKEIDTDPVYFPKVSQLFSLVAHQGMNARQATEVMRERFGFVTPPAHGKPGGPLPYTTAHRILTDPFYRGVIEWKGEVYPGAHEPAVSEADFKAVQRRLDNGAVFSKPYAVEATYRQMLTCGRCGRIVTTEPKINRQGHEYLYYHCSGRRPFVGCQEPSLEARKVDASILERLREFAIDDRFTEWVMDRLEADEREGEVLLEAHRAALEQKKAEADRQADILLDLRLAGQIETEAFEARYADIEARRSEAGAELQAAPTAESLIEPAGVLILTSKYAADWFEAADSAGRRLILEIVGSNPVLVDGKVRFEAAKPFQEMQEIQSYPSLLGDWVMNRTRQKDEALMKRLADLVGALRSEDGRRRLDRARALVERMQVCTKQSPEVLKSLPPRTYAAPRARRQDRTKSKSTLKARSKRAVSRAKS